MTVMTVEEIERLNVAISGSLDLLRNYAFLLNKWDGGQRVIPYDIGEWIEILNREESP